MLLLTVLEVQVEGFHAMFGKIRRSIRIWIDHPRRLINISSPKTSDHYLRSASTSTAANLLVNSHRFARALINLTQSSLVVLALSSEHMQLLFKVFQRLFDRLLAAITFLVSHLERTRQMLTVLCQSVQLLVLAPQSLIQLLDQIVLHLYLIRKSPVLLALLLAQVF